ncbi:MAG: hypothetical protein ACI9FZ_001240 [Bacteroidia bacterium]
MYANRHGAELLSFCFQQNRHLTWGLTHCFCGRGLFLCPFLFKVTDRRHKRRRREAFFITEQETPQHD